MHNRSTLGIVFVCLGVLVFSLQDAIIKLVSGAYPVTVAANERGDVGTA